MSVANFQPTIWSARVLAHLDKALVLANLVNRDYEGEIARFGDQVRINRPGNIPAVTYAAGGTISYGAPFGAQQTLSINRRSIAAFRVDSLARVQANVDLLDRFSERMGFALADDIDRAIAAEHASAQAGTVAINVSGAIAAGALTDAFANAGALLSATSTPSAGRWAAVSPTVVAAIARDSRVWQGLQTADNVARVGGYLGRFMGFDLFESNNLLGTGTAVTLTAAAATGATSITVTALAAAIPANSILTFAPGHFVRTTAAAAAAATSIAVAPLEWPLAIGASATHIRVRACLFGTRNAITLAMQYAPAVEVLRDRDTTEDFVRAEQAYGIRTIEPLALGLLNVTEVA